MIGNRTSEGTGKPRVLCVAPAWNEGQRIARVVETIPRESVELTVVVDDGSTDDTAQQARAAGALVIRNEKNSGVGAAIRHGIDYAIKHGYDIVVVISGAGKTPAERIPVLLKPIIEGNAEIVQGSRYIQGGLFSGAPLHRRIGTRAYTFLFSIFAGRFITDASSGFRAIRLSIFEDKRINLWQSWLDRYELEPYLLFKAVTHGHNVVEAPIAIEYPPKTDQRGYTHMRVLIDWWKIFRPILFLALRLKR